MIDVVFMMMIMPFLVVVGGGSSGVATAEAASFIANVISCSMDVAVAVTLWFVRCVLYRSLCYNV